MGCVESSLSPNKPALILNGKVIEIIPKNNYHQHNDDLRVSVASSSSSISPYVSLQPYNKENEATQQFIVKHRDLKKIEKTHLSPQKKESSSSSSSSFSGSGSSATIAPQSYTSLTDKTDKTRREKVAFSPLLAPHRCIDSRGGVSMGLILFDGSSENPNQSYTLIEQQPHDDQHEQEQIKNNNNKDSLPSKSPSSLSTDSSNSTRLFSIGCYSSQEKKHYFWSVQEGGKRLTLLPASSAEELSDNEKFYIKVVSSMTPTTLTPSTSTGALSNLLHSSQNSSVLSSPPTSARDTTTSRSKTQKVSSSAESEVSEEEPDTLKTSLPHILSERFPSDVDEDDDNENEQQQQISSSSKDEIAVVTKSTNKTKQSSTSPPSLAATASNIMPSAVAAGTSSVTTTTISGSSLNNSRYLDPSTHHHYDDAMMVGRTVTHDEYAFS